MAAFDLLEIQLNKALQTALTVADGAGLSIGVPENVETIKRGCREIPYLNRQVIAAFRGDNALKEDLQHRLDCVRDDAVSLVDWLEGASKSVLILLEAYHKALAESGNHEVASLRYDKRKVEVNHECERRQELLKESCDQALDEARRVCAADDKTAQEQEEASKLPAVKETTRIESGDKSNLTLNAVLEIIKAQPRGEGIQGKEIIRELRAANISLAESTLRRHILPKLISDHGVINHPSAGGYLIPRHSAV